jgi:hypothetical protein
LTKGTINGEPYSVPDGYTVVSEAAHFRAAAALDLLQDLDRSEHGRHQGDVESQSPTGFSRGNPLLSEGDHIGHTIGGLRIVVPSNDKLGDPDAWVVPRQASTVQSSEERYGPLSYREGRILELSIVEDRSWEQIAASFQISVERTKLYARQAIKKLMYSGAWLARERVLVEALELARPWAHCEAESGDPVDPECRCDGCNLRAALDAMQEGNDA